MRGRFHALLFILAVTVIASCTRPASFEHFIKAGDAAASAVSKGGVYRFGLDFSDSLSTYDIFLYTRLADFGIGNRVHSEEPLGLDVRWISPKMETLLEERVYMRCGGARGSKELYRSGVKPSPAGEWTLEFRPVPETTVAISGLGIICKRNGTR